MAHEPVHAYKQEERVPMSYSPAAERYSPVHAATFAVPVGLRTCLPATQFISNSSSILHFTRITTIDILIPQAAKPWAKPAGGPVAIVRRHAHDSLLACIQSLLSEPSFSLLCFPFPPCSAGCRMHTHTHELQNSAPPRLPDSPPLHTSPSLNFAPRAETNHCSRPTGQPLDQQDAQTEPFFIILSHPSPP